MRTTRDPLRIAALSAAIACTSLACPPCEPPAADAGPPPLETCPTEVPVAYSACAVPETTFCEYTLCPNPSYVAQCTAEYGWVVDEVPCYPSTPDCPAQIPEPGSACANYIDTCYYYFEDCDGEPSAMAECPGGTGSWVVTHLQCAGAPL